MSLKLNIPVRCFVTEIAYYSFEIERDGTIEFITESGDVESVAFSKVKPYKDFKTIEPTDSTIEVKAGETLYLTVKGKNYVFTLMEKLDIQLGSYKLSPNLKYTIEASDRNLLLKVKDTAQLEITINGITETIEVNNSELVFNCRGGVGLKFSESIGKIEVELCQAFF